MRWENRSLEKTTWHDHQEKFDVPCMAQTHDGHCSETIKNVISDAHNHSAQVFEPPRGKTNNVVSEQVRHKPTCTSTEKS